MRIATMVCSQYSLPVPEDVIYAPMELAAELADRLKKRGHKITFYGPPSPKFQHRVISGKLDAQLQGHRIFQPGMGGMREREKVYNLYDQYLQAQLYKDARAGKYDIAHIHPIDRGLPLAELADIPTVYTLHDPIFAWRAEIFRLYQGPKQNLVSISDNQRRGAPDVKYAATIYNGIDIDRYAFSERPGKGFMFCGRILPQKGVKYAAMAAKLAGVKLEIIGKTYPENTYFQDEVKPLLDKNIRLIDVDRSELPKHYAKARALLFPITWAEPFGLVMTEAMACGTPVIAFNYGSVPEVVKDGVTGFIVKNHQEMAEAMKVVDKLDRRACRNWVAKNFTLDRMTDRYEALFARLVKNRAG